MKKALFVITLFLLSFSVYALREEEIFVQGTGQLMKFSLSNDPREIEQAAKIRVDVTIDLSEVNWTINPDLDHAVKDLMNKFKVSFSMTTWLEDSYRYIIVNRLAGNRWFYTLFRISN